MVFHVDGKRLLLLWLWLVSTTLCEFANRLDDALDDGDAPEELEESQGKVGNEEDGASKRIGVGLKESAVKEAVDDSGPEGVAFNGPLEQAQPDEGDGKDHANQGVGGGHGLVQLGVLEDVDKGEGNV